MNRTPLRFTSGVAVALVALAMLAVPAQASRSTVAAQSPYKAVWHSVASYTATGANSSCHSAKFHYGNCPMTARLKKRLAYLLKFRADPLCRCQNRPNNVVVHPPAMQGSTATVNTSWSYGAGSSESITFVAIEGKGMMTWKVDDTYCKGKPDTSIYKPPKGAC